MLQDNLVHQDRLDHQDIKVNEGYEARQVPLGILAMMVVLVRKVTNTFKIKNILTALRSINSLSPRSRKSSSIATDAQNRRQLFIRCNDDNRRVHLPFFMPLLDTSPGLENKRVCGKET